jgi:hypothetical protein
VGVGVRLDWNMRSREEFMGEIVARMERVKEDVKNEAMKLAKK